jgi:4-hydroxy-tetrahydrodipicolinate synthase
LAPNLCVSVIDRYAAGDLPGCFEAYNRLMHLFTATRDMGGITGTKAALQLLGLPGGTMRRPRLALPGVAVADSAANDDRRRRPPNDRRTVIR